jgi:hypothetical protein
MTSKLIALMVIAGASAFAQARFSIHIGGYGPGYYAPPPVYYAPARPHVYYSIPGWGGAGYWGEDPEKQHERAEWRGLHNHQEGERYMYGDSPELREHQAQERWQLRHEQWHERNGDYDAADGPAHGSARDGMYPYGVYH